MKNISRYILYFFQNYMYSKFKCSFNKYLISQLDYVLVHFGHGSWEVALSEQPLNMKNSPTSHGNSPLLL